MTPLFRIDNLTKSFAGSQVITDISFSLRKGEILCLLGPSGSGKTTLLRLLAGLEQPDTGRFLFDGRDLATISPHKRHFGMMFQEYALFPHKNVERNIRFGLEMMKWSTEKQQQRVEEMLTLVGLENMGRRRIDELSGGERQRVALARSLAPQPRLLLLDEPLGSLDRVLRDRLAGEIRSILKSRQVTAVFVTHDQAEAFAVADTIAVLRQGRLEQIACPEMIYRSPQTAEVAAFLGFRNLIDCSRHRPTDFFRQIPTELEAFRGHLLLRPEGARISVQGRTAVDWPRLTVRVTKRQFQGQTYSMEMTIHELQLYFDLPIDPAPPEIGERIQLDINPMAVVQLGGQSK